MKTRLLLQYNAEALNLMKKMVRVSWRQCNTSDTVPCDIGKPSGHRTSAKNKNNLECHRSDVSEIKLKRTDTTLDLSQLAKRAGEEKKEEEGCWRRAGFIPGGTGR